MRQGTPKQKQEQGSCQEAQPGKDSGSSVRHTPPEGAGPHGAADPRVSPRLCTARQDRKETEALSFVHTGSLCGIFPPLGLELPALGSSCRVLVAALPPPGRAPGRLDPRWLTSAHLPAPANASNAPGCHLCVLPTSWTNHRGWGRVGVRVRVGPIQGIFNLGRGLFLHLTPQ